MAGRILDKSTGAGVAGIGVQWSIQRNGMNIHAPQFTTDETGRFEFTDAPAERVFLIFSWHSDKRIVSDNDSNYAMPDGPEALIYMADASAK